MDVGQSRMLMVAVSMAAMAILGLVPGAVPMTVMIMPMAVAMIVGVLVR